MSITQLLRGGKKKKNKDTQKKGLKIPQKI